MKDSGSWLTPSQAAKILGCTARHITNCINRGKVSATREDGKFYIDKSEFYRAFPEAHIKEQQRNPENKQLEQERIKLENQMLKEMASLKDKEIEFLRNQIEMFNRKESQLLETIQSHTRLLEYQEHKTGTPTKRHWTEIFRKK